MAIKIHQMSGTVTEGSQNMYTNSSQNPPKFTQIGIFGFDNKPSGTQATKNVSLRNKVIKK
jgi:hypothetical protein